MRLRKKVWTPDVAPDTSPDIIEDNSGRLDASSMSVPELVDINNTLMHTALFNLWGGQRAQKYSGYKLMTNFGQDCERTKAFRSHGEDNFNRIIGSTVLTEVRSALEVVTVAEPTSKAEGWVVDVNHTDLPPEFSPLPSAYMGRWCAAVLLQHLLPVETGIIFSTTYDNAFQASEYLDSHGMRHRPDPPLDYTDYTTGTRSNGVIDESMIEAIVADIIAEKRNLSVDADRSATDNEDTKPPRLSVVGGITTPPRLSAVREDAKPPRLSGSARDVLKPEQSGETALSFGALIMVNEPAPKLSWALDRNVRYR